MSTCLEEEDKPFIMSHAAVRIDTPSLAELSAASNRFFTSSSNAASMVADPRFSPTASISRYSHHKFGAGTCPSQARAVSIGLAKGLRWRCWLLARPTDPRIHCSETVEQGRPYCTYGGSSSSVAYQEYISFLSTRISCCTFFVAINPSMVPGSTNIHERYQHPPWTREQRPPPLQSVRS